MGNVRVIEIKEFLKISGILSVRQSSILGHIRM